MAFKFIKNLFFGGAEKKAARRQVRGAQEAIGTQNEFLDLARGDLQQFREAGEGILDPLTDFVRQGPETDFERTEGFRQIQNSAAAGSKLRSGGTLTRLTEFNAGVNERFRSNRFAELFNLATLSANAAAGQATASLRTGENISGLQVGQGNARAAGIIGAKKATRNTLSDLASFAVSSDRRLKNNIHRIGTVNGYPWYSFDYVWGVSSEGVMSDEIPQQYVSVDKFGYDMVDYSAFLGGG